MTAPALAPLSETDGRPVWSWPIAPDRYNRRPDLTVLESEALRRLGMNLRRRRCYDRDAPEWDTIGRLLRPLDDARAAMHCPDTPHHRRAITDAIGLILLRAAELGTAYWAWTPDEWLRLIGTSADEFEKPWPGWIDGTVRPYVAAYGYLLCGFTDFDRLGPFNRLALTWRVFGTEPVDRSIQQVTDVLGRWGYRIGRGEDQRLPTVLCQALLLNRSPLLEDLTTDAFARLRKESACVRWHTGSLHGIQRAVAALGHCEPPSRLSTAACPRSRAPPTAGPPGSSAGTPPPP
ncbi:hypothetical protein ABZW30_45725 [Kitasatospora sp. NPDC004669]|uniref:hypothetical protein n=1 Tax=Kitasatospora sp. NPDC004669 TaxID=3154555 RepID=UPI0033AEB4BE